MYLEYGLYGCMPGNMCMYFGIIESLFFKVNKTDTVSTADSRIFSTLNDDLHIRVLGDFYSIKLIFLVPSFVCCYFFSPSIVTMKRFFLFLILNTSVDINATYSILSFQKQKLLLFVMLDVSIEILSSDFRY